MKHLDEFRDPHLARPLVDALHKAVTKPFRVMEICGSHTMAIFRNGIRSILPEGVSLISGPGCPVCVTSAPHMDAFIAMAALDNVRVAIFGDLFRVPGTNGSLSDASSRGAKVDIVYSPMDALDIAMKHPEEQVVFLGVGFETTTPAIAATIMAAKNQGVKNFSVFSTQKIMGPPMQALLGDPELKIDALLCPGHVSSIVGVKEWEPLARDYNLACVVAGFETADLINALIMLAKQIANDDIKVENSYSRAVSYEGNPRAQSMVYQIFEPADMLWRGLGTIPGSGLKIRSAYAEFDAEIRFDISLPDVEEAKGCKCGEILKGLKTPRECPLFAKKCSPENPIGPCMVSSEGTCAAYHKYGLDE